MSEYDKLIAQLRSNADAHHDFPGSERYRAADALELEILNHESTKSCLDDAWRELHFRRNLFTIGEAADLVGLRPATIAKLIGEGELAYTFVDGKQHVGGTSLWEYSERRKAEKAKAFEELRAIDEELGLGDG